MAELKDLLNALGSGSSFKENIKTKDLIINKKYRIFHITAVKTVHGKKLLADLGQYSYFLPERFAKSMAGLRQFRNKFIPEKDLYIVYKGSESRGGFNVPIFEFIEEENVEENWDTE